MNSLAQAMLLAGLIATEVQAGPAIDTQASRPSYFEALNRRAAERLSPDAPGCVIGVIRKGREEFTGAFGLASIEGHVPLTPASRIAIASVSKQFTAFAILLLERDGRIRLDAPIETYLKGLPDWGARVTVADLIHHSSGIRDYLWVQSLRGLGDEDYYSADEAYSVIARTNLEFEPGERASYSNSGYFLLGRIVEQVSGKSLRQFMAERIFEPLGMEDTFLQDDMSERFERQAYGYTTDAKGAPRRDGSRIEIVGDGGVVTTLHDMALWDANFYDNRLGGGQDLIRAALRTGVLRNGEATPHAAGLFVRQVRGQTRVGHNGFYGGFKASIQRYPDLGVTIAVLCNSDQLNPGAEDRWITELVLGDKLEPLPPPAPRADEPGPAPAPPFRGRLEDGVYFSAELGVAWRLTCQGQGCSAVLPTGKKFDLVASGADRLSEAGGEFNLTPAGPGQFNVSYEDAQPIVFRRKPS